MDASERVKVSVGVSPALRDVMSELMAIVGLRVSMESVSELLLWLLSALVLPAESEKTPEATEITPSLLLSMLGVKLAV